MSNNLYNTLGLANRARKLVSGESIIKAIENKKAYLVFIAEDASENTKKKYIDKCNYYGVDYVVYGDSDTLSKAIGKSRVAVAIIESGFALNIKKKLGG